ncbi:helix-turn-helix domain-containing protein [Tumebacillus flagellatus]|uniref:HTH cro/C1-type domain-containing protein n=1 Tax=Tumebacillus flagellatus TaxID=1157490 RepID=A0A074LTI9_9BACL|nr:helix-turn-helix transcriptional regulator [Tumebacillus flagellatus]KEO84399.1 hypothetical protein EL26_04665 [Tumebacillus flagellatus]
MSEPLLTIGQRVKRRRAERGMSQAELAEGICSHQTVSLLETDKHTPSADILRKLAEKLLMPLHEIVRNRESELDVKLQTEIAKIYVEQGEYDLALQLVCELDARADVTESQQIQLTLLRAECLMRTRQAKTAIEMLVRLKHRLEAVRDMDDLFMAEFYNKLGNAYYYASNMIYAHTHYMQALEACGQVPGTEMRQAEFKFNLGTACMWLGFYSDAMAYISEAHEYFDEMSDPHRLAAALFQMGLLHKQMGEYGQAEAFLQQSLHLYRSQRVVEMAYRVRQQYASFFLAETDPERAVRELQECLKEFEQAGDHARVVHSCAKIASLYIDLNRLKEANHYLILAFDRIEETSMQADPRYVYAFQVFAKYSYQTKDYAQAIEYSLQASEQYERMGLQRDSADTLQICVLAYRAQGNLNKAFNMLMKANESLQRSQEVVCLQEGRNVH